LDDAFPFASPCQEAQMSQMPVDRCPCPKRTWEAVCRSHLAPWLLVFGGLGHAAGCGYDPSAEIDEVPDQGALSDPAPDQGGALDDRVDLISSARLSVGVEVCDGLDNDGDGVADDGLSGCDVCAPRLELPVVTHWSSTLNGEQYLATGQASIDSPYPGGTYVAGTCYPIYSGGRRPDLNRYIGDRWSTSAIPDAEALSVFRAVCVASKVPVRLLRPDAVGTTRLLSRPGAVQVVNGLVVDGSLVTVVLPANWSQSALAATYPIVANGFYDLNANVFRGEGPDLIRMIALSGSAGRSGAIGVLWNGGGAVARPRGATVRRGSPPHPDVRWLARRRDRPGDGLQPEALRLPGDLGGGRGAPGARG
jgi:hypothetical protein